MGIEKPELAADEVALLRRTALFAGLDDGLFQRALNMAVPLQASRDTVLFHHGDGAASFFIVLSGWVKLARVTAEGQESVIAVFGPGEGFAEAAVFRGGHYPASAHMLEAGRLLVLPARPFLALAAAETCLMTNFMEAMTVHLRALVRHVEDLSTRTAAQRLAGFIANLARRAEGGAVRLPVEKGTLAAYLGMRPETFSRTLRRLSAQGVREVDGCLVVEDVGRLERLASGQAREQGRDRGRLSSPPARRPGP